MPKIQEYGLPRDLPNVPQGKSASAQDFFDSRGIEDLGNAVRGTAEVVNQRAEQQEIADTNAKLSGLQAGYTTQLRDSLNTSEPGDPNLAEDFNKSVDDDLSAIGDSLQTRGARLHFQNQAGSLRAHFAESIAAGQAELAGVKAKQDYLKTVSNFSSALTNDPSSLEMTLKMHDENLDALVNSGSLPRVEAEKLKNQGRSELAKASIRGWIDLDPNYVKEEMKKGKWDDLLFSEQGDGSAIKRQLAGEADQAIRGRDADAEMQRKNQERILKDQQTVTQNDFLVKLSKGTLNSAMINKSNLDPVGSGSKEQFIQLLRTEANAAERPIHSNPQVLSEVFSRIHLPDGDARKILNENDLNQYYVKRQLSWPDLMNMRGEIQGKRTVEGSIEADLKKGLMTTARNTLTKSSFGLKDPIGDEQYQRFMTYFFDSYQKQKQAGKTATQLLDPDSPDYLGKGIQQFVRSDQDKIQTIVQSMQTSPTTKAVTAPKEGDTHVDGRITYKVVGGHWVKVK